MGQNSFYNGDTDGVDGWSSQHGGSVTDSRIYEDFTLGSATHVNNIYADYWDSTSGGVAATTYWEIRTGVVGGFGGSGGSGGTLVAGGFASASTRADRFINYFGYEIYRYSIDVSGMSVNLGAGTYWMTLAPDCTNLTGQAFIGTTANAAATGGFMNDGLAVWDSTQFGISWQNALAQFNDGSHGEVTMGLDGSGVPEPATLAVLGVGALALIRRRRSK